MKEFQIEQLYIGIIVASILIILIILPIYCCQVSNEDYQQILAKFKEKKIKLQKQKLQKSNAKAQQQKSILDASVSDEELLKRMILGLGKIDFFGDTILMFYIQGQILLKSL